MPGFGLEFGGGASVGGQVLEGGVAELMERPALLVWVVGGCGLLEQVLGTRVEQPAVPPYRIDVSAIRLSMNVSTWVPSAATVAPSPQARARSSSLNASTTSAMARLSLPIVACRRALTPSSCADTPAMCRAACAGPRLLP
jgi:hypothetical protein